MVADSKFKNEMGNDLKEIHFICKSCLKECKKLQLKKYVFLPSKCPDFIDGITRNLE